MFAHAFVRPRNLCGLSTSTVVLAAFVTLLLTLSSASASAAPSDGQKFKDWTARCEKFKNKNDEEFEQCHIFQDWHHKEQKLRILHIAFAYPPQNPDRAVGVLTMPLGIFLPFGVKFKIDQDEALQLPVERCEPVGCKAGFPLNAQMVNKLRKGIKAFVTFSDMRRKPITVPVSLRGFTAGLKALE